LDWFHWVYWYCLIEIVRDRPTQNKREKTLNTWWV